MKIINKLAAVLLVTIITLSLLPLGVLAEENSRTPSEESVYSSIIEKYIEGINNKWDAGQFSDAGLNFEFGFIDFDKKDYMQNAGYFYQDIDGNGVQELFIASECGNNSRYLNMFWDMYTIVDEKPVLVVRGQARDRYYLCKDNKIANEGSGGAKLSIWSYYTYSDIKLNLVESVLYFAQEYPENPWRYSTESDTIETIEDEKKFVPITEEKSKEIRNSYEYADIKYTPFSEYKKTITGPRISVDYSTVESINCDKGIFEQDVFPLDVTVWALANVQSPSEEDTAKNVKLNVSLSEGMSLDKNSEVRQKEYTLGDIKEINFKKQNIEVFTHDVGPDKGLSELKITITVSGDNIEAIEKNIKIKIIDTIKPSSKFEIGKDNLNFLNSENAESYATGMNQKNVLTNKTYFETLINGMDNTVIENIQKKMKDNWGGTCYGMTVVEALNKYGNRLALDNYQANINTLYELADYKDNPMTAALLNYYQLMQYLPDRMKYLEEQKQNLYINEKTLADNIINVAQKAHDEGKPSVLIYCYLEGWFGSPIRINDWNEELEKNNQKTLSSHAVLIYDFNKKEDGSYEIMLCDPNNQKESILTISSDRKEIKLPYESLYSPLTYSKKNEDSNFLVYSIMSDIDQLDIINIEGRDNRSKLKTYNKDGFISLETTAQTGFSVKLLDGTIYNTFENGPLSINNALIDISALPDGTSKQNVIYQIENSHPLTIAPNTNDKEIDMNIISNNLSANIKGIDVQDITFDPLGKVAILGDNVSYYLSLTLNQNQINDDSLFYTICAKGNNANEVALQNTEKGIVVSGNNLKNVKITGNNTDVKKELLFNTEKEKVLIQEKNGELTASVDKDNNGNYETIIAVSSESVALQSIELDKSEAALKIGETATLAATVAPADATNKNVSWASSDEAIATVKDGVVTAVAAGKATITVTTEDGQKTAECVVTVTKKDDPKPTTPTTPTVKPGDNGQSGSNNGTTTETTAKTAVNNGTNPNTSLTTQEKVGTMLVWCTVTALCVLAVFSIKRRQTK